MVICQCGGWFPDSTSRAYGRIDLLSVVAHELGHVLGFEDLDPSVDPAAVMAGTLSAGHRRLVGDSTDVLAAPSYCYGTITGVNLAINGTPVTTTIPYGDLESIVDSDTLEPLAAIGISLERGVILKINVGGPAEGRDVTLKLPGREPDEFHLPQNSFAVYIYCDATFCPPPGNWFSLEMTRAFSLELDKVGLRLFLLASFEMEVGGATLMQFQALGLMKVVIDYDENGHFIVSGLAPTITGGTLNGLAALVIVQAGDGTGDLLNVDDSGDTTDNIGEMTDHSITGLGMGGGIGYYDLETLNLWLGEGADTFTAHSTHTQLTSLYAGDGSDIITLEDTAGLTNIHGAAGDDQITVDTLVSLDTGLTGDTVNLDGQAGSDDYIVNVTGSGDYLINVLDTGNGESDEDTLAADGTAEADNFLLRASEHEHPTGIAFVAALHGEPVSDVERVDYNEAIEQLAANGGDGNDPFTIDDNWATTTITGGAGEDLFQVGQIFKTQRDAASANIAGEDEFATTLTARGYLSNGVSVETTIEGNDDNDEFCVFRNLAELHLLGGAGNDSFAIRTFALEGLHTTELSGEGGMDHVEYVANAPVKVLGGDGSDRLKVIGTEFSDQIVITNAGIFGMGLGATYGEIEKLEVDGAEGDDMFYVLSTGEGVDTWLYGGLGSDRFSVAGDVPQIMSGETEIYPETEGPHKLEAIQGPLHIEGMAGQGSAGGLGTPVMLPGETNALMSTGEVVSYTGIGEAGSIDTMTVETADLQALIDADDELETLEDLIGLTLEISQGFGEGRFWQIIDVEPASETLTLVTLKSPAIPASEWGLPDATSEFAITHLAANFFVNEENQVDFATIYNDGAAADQSGTLTAATLAGFGMATDGISYGGLEALDIFLGSGADTLSVTGVMKRDNGFQTVTMVNTGGANDDVTVSVADGGLFVLNTEAGDDHVHAAASTLPLILFGGEGDDLIESGHGDDCIEGTGAVT